MDREDYERYHIQTVTMHNVFKPRWWQIRFRFRLWRSRRTHEKALAKLTPEGREMLDTMEKEIERRILFGDE